MRAASKFVWIADEQEDTTEEFDLDAGNDDLFSEEAPARERARSAQPQQQQQQQQQQQAKRKVKRVRRADTNVLVTKLNTLTGDVALATGDPVFCNHCGAVLSAISQVVDAVPAALSPAQAGPSAPATTTTTTSTAAAPAAAPAPAPAPAPAADPADFPVGAQLWVCEFCAHRNPVVQDPEERPKEESVDFIIEPPSAGGGVSQEESMVLFVVDTSGSMCSSYELEGKIKLRGAERLQKLQSLNDERGDQFLPGQRRNVTYISRLQCVQAAISAQLEQMSKETPNRRVGLVTFNSEVTIVGDGTGHPVTVTGDRLHDYDALREVGEHHSISNPIGQTFRALNDKLFTLEETGATALGPALVVALGMASKRQASKVVVCTDGLANVGLGDMDNIVTPQDNETVQQFYEQLGNAAKIAGVTISLLSIRGSDCKLENLGQLADLTQGSVDIVDPLHITSDFQSILSVPVIATHVSVTLRLHKGLFFRLEDDDDSAAKYERHTLTRDVGNVTNETEFTFEYGVRPRRELERLVDLATLRSLPFQLEIRYTKLDGMKCMRIITQAQPFTFDRNQAEREADVDMLGLHAVQTTANIAQKGDYGASRLNNFTHQALLNRVVQTTGQTDARKKWVAHGQALEKKIRQVETTERSMGLAEEEDDDFEAPPQERAEKEKEKKTKKVELFKARKAARDDDSANMFYQLKQVSVSKAANPKSK